MIIVNKLNGINNNNAAVTRKNAKKMACACIQKKNEKNLLTCVFVFQLIYHSSKLENISLKWVGIFGSLLVFKIFKLIYKILKKKLFIIKY